jgi:hypothetical protein
LPRWLSAQATSPPPVTSKNPCPLLDPWVLGNDMSVIGEASGSAGGESPVGISGQISHLPTVLVTVQFSSGLVTVAPAGTRLAVGSSSSTWTVRLSPAAVASGQVTR